MTEQRLADIERRLSDLQRADLETAHILDRLTTAIELLTTSQVNQQRILDDHTSILNEHTGLLHELIALVGNIDDRLANVEQILRERGHQNGASST